MPAGSHPIDVAVDSKGTVWSANIDGHSVGSFVPGTVMLTVFDLGVGVGPEAVAVGPNDIVYTANGSANTISKIERMGAGFVTTAKFAELVGAQPLALAIDAAGDIYTANTNNGTVSKVSAVGRVIDVFAKLPAGGHPDAIAIDSHGMLYVADTDHDSVVKIDPSKPLATNIIATYQLAAGAKPFGLTVDARDNVYVTNRATSTVDVIPDGATVATTIQTMPVGSGLTGITVSPANVLLTTSFARAVVSSLDLTTVLTLTKPVADVDLGASVSGSFTATGVDPLTFSSADLPAWLTLNPTTGAFTGTPPTSGPVSFSVVANSLVGASNPVTVSFTVIGAAPTATPTPTSTPGQTTPPTTVPGTGGGGSTGGSAGGGSGSGSTSGRGGSTGSLAHTGADAGGAVGLVGSGLGLVALGIVVGVRRRRRTV